MDPSLVKKGFSRKFLTIPRPLPARFGQQKGGSYKEG